MNRRAWFWLAVLGIAGCQGGSGSSSGEYDTFSAETFANPPREFGPQARWWWPGGSVDDDTLVAQIEELQALGYSAVEIQPFMAVLTNADLAEDQAIRTVGDASFLEHLRVAACAATERGMFWDLTLGSGWSTGGPEVGDDGARQLLLAELTLTGPLAYDGPLPQAEPPAWIDQTNAILPAIDGFDQETVLVKVLAAPLVDEPEAGQTTLGTAVDLDANVEDGVLTWDVPSGPHRVFAVYENRTLHYPLGNAYATPLEDARIIDHLDRRGVEGFLERQFGAWLDATADCPPRAVFIDSFELVGELPWTTTFADRFETDFEYSLDSLLPFLFLEGGESEYVNIRGEPDPRYRAVDDTGERAREDYEAFRSSSFTDELLQVVNTWLAEPERGIELRLQAHGGYADALDAYSLSDVPEAEGLYAGGSYDFLRLSASAAQVMGKRFVSSETLVSVGARELTLDEVRLLFGRAFSAGINRLMLHGHAYPYEHTDGVRWFPFGPREDSAVTTGPLDLSFDLNPDADIWSELPALNAMTTRLGYAMSRGDAVSQVAWLYPDWKIPNFANFGVRPGDYESDVSKAVRSAGYTYARVSRSALASSDSTDGTLTVGEATFDALLITDLPPVDPAVLEAAEAAASSGVPVIWLGEFPERADGLRDAEARDASVQARVDALEPLVSRVSVATEIPVALRDAGITPPLSPVSSDPLRLSIAHRRLSDGALYLLVNESFAEVTESLELPPAATVELYDPDTGAPVDPAVEANVLTLTLPPTATAILLLR